MALSLHNLKPTGNSRKKRKRVGRGNASGYGTYSTRGIKGQRARSGGKGGLKIKGFRDRLLNTPKTRGFKSHQAKPVCLNLKDIDINFKSGEKISPRVLKQKGLISKINTGVKILGEGELKKKLVFENCQFSKSAKEKIEKAGGSIG